MSLVTPILRTLLAVVVLISAAGCSVAVPAGTAPAIGILRMGEPGHLNPGPLNPGPLNRAEQLLPKVNAQPWAAPLPVVVQSAGKDMQCSISADAAACHLLTEVPPRPGDIKGQCTGVSEYFGGYAVVTLDGGAQYGLCGNGTSPMEAEEVAGPAFPGPWIQDGQTVRLGNIVCERAPGAMTCAHLRTGHGFMISTDNYELW
ncbi:hypothetical protein ASF98_09475 [Arthrobacter sp. Leaf337]|uniref:hypothetical protein n=1 Tax=Arthrobacter sp. Leaf337 TaxID=1736342 RepID=UPI0006FD35BC|nr:hypothetical protein [Arthrobacter sp. Leaf337]KQR67180.1 hypothetical protein ASF98_09475 [Arthrobacter sp. Leaf337]